MLVVAGPGGDLILLLILAGVAKWLIVTTGRKGGSRRTTRSRRRARRSSRDTTGKAGEACVAKAINRALDKRTYTLMSDITLPAGNGTTQIDHAVVSRYGVFVIETKDYSGWIFGDVKQAKWTQTIYGHKSRFQNPLRQNYRHTKALSELTGIPHHYFKSIVAFAGDATFKTEMPTNVVYVRNLARHISGHKDYIIRDDQVPEVVSTIRDWAGTVSHEARKMHVQILQENRRPAAPNANPTCPRCAAPMILRTNRRDQSRFWGCPKYPSCKGARNVA